MSVVYLQYVVLDSAYSYVGCTAKELSLDMTVQALADSAKNNFCRRLRLDTSDSDVDVEIYQARNSTFCCLLIFSLIARRTYRPTKNSHRMHQALQSI